MNVDDFRVDCVYIHYSDFCASQVLLIAHIKDRVKYKSKDKIDLMCRLLQHAGDGNSSRQLPAWKLFLAQELLVA